MRINHILVASLLWATASPICNAGDLPLTGAKSVAQSKKRDLFIGLVTVEPSAFDWKGQAVVFHEIWLERGVIHNEKIKNPEQDFLCCSFLLDGKRELGTLDQTDLKLVPDDTHVNAHGARLCGYKTVVLFTPLQKARLELGLPESTKTQGPIKHFIWMPSESMPSVLHAHVTSGKPESLKSNTAPTTVNVIFHLPSH